MKNTAFRLIAFDLDGTLLDDEKRIPGECLRALRAAGEAGLLLVPATGRIPAGLPDELLALPGLRYGLLVNGALLYDFEAQRVLGAEEIPLETALEVVDFLAALPVLDDCYQGGWGYMDRALYDAAADYIEDRGILELLWRVRTPVPSLRRYLAEQGRGVEKLQLHTKDRALRRRLLEELPARFPSLAVTTSIPTNIELNAARANKGDALLRLCALLGLDPAAVLAFGDGTNDLSLLRAAGCGVAMANAAPEVLAAAKLVAPSNNEAGMAQVLRRILSDDERSDVR